MSKLADNEEIQRNYITIMEDKNPEVATTSSSMKIV